MLTRYDPFKDMIALQDRMNRLFDEFFRRSEIGPESASAEWKPLADVYEDGNEIVLSIEIPGVNKDNIKVTVENNILTVSGERKQEREEKKENYHRIERAYGSFSRSFSLPNTVDSNNIKASYKNGVLELVLPKKEEAKPKAINVKVG